MCNLYAMTGNQQAIREAARVMTDRTGNLRPLPEIWPNTMAPIVRNAPDGRELVMARWGMPTPPGYLKGHRVDRGVTNIRNPTSTWWKRWESAAHRCLSSPGSGASGRRCGNWRMARRRMTCLAF